MTPELQSANLASWERIAAFVEEGPDTEYWAIWKPLARRFVQAGISAGLDRYFRAGSSMHHLVFSTLEHHRLRDEPRITIEFHPPEDVRVAYGTENIWFHAGDPEYSLTYDEAFPTFCRFLQQLWSATVPEPVPAELRKLVVSLSPPVLPRVLSIL